MRKIRGPVFALFILFLASVSLGGENLPLNPGQQKAWEKVLSQNPQAWLVHKPARWGGISIALQTFGEPFSTTNPKALEVVILNEFFSKYAELFQLPPESEFRPRLWGDGRVTEVVLQQYFNGIPIVFATLMVGMTDGEIHTVIGEYISKREAERYRRLPTLPEVPQEDVLKVVEKAADYNVDLMRIARKHLAYYPMNGEPRLVWYVQARLKEEEGVYISLRTFIIDAMTGKVLEISSR